MNSLCTGWTYPAPPPPKRRLQRGPAITVYVVFTTDRVFTFTALGRAETFARRARRCPSMKGVDVSVVMTTTNGSLRRAR